MSEDCHRWGIESVLTISLTLSQTMSHHTSNIITNTRAITEDPLLTMDQKQDLIAQLIYDEHIISSKAARAIKEIKVCKSEKPKTIADWLDTAFVTEHAKKAGLANASSGRIFVTVPRDHFGPMMAENDPERNRGVLVGDRWNSIMEAKQWGVHLTHVVSGISGQSKTRAQSVVLSGGYKDDVDHGEWFLYT